MKFISWDSVDEARKSLDEAIVRLEVVAVF